MIRDLKERGREPFQYLGEQTYQAEKKSKNKDILKSVACVGIGQIINLGWSLAFSFKPGSQRKHLSKRERLWSSLAST